MYTIYLYKYIKYCCPKPKQRNIERPQVRCLYSMLKTFQSRKENTITRYFSYNAFMKKRSLIRRQYMQ